MTRLSRPDLEAVLDVVRTVSAVVDPGEFSQTAVRGLAGVVRTDSVTINEVDPVAGRTAYVVEPASFVIPPGSEALLAEMAGEHPLIGYFLSTGDGSAKLMSDFLSREEFHASRLYQLLYRSLGVEYQMSVGLPAPRPVVIGIALNRGDRDFSERDREVMNVLRPHLMQAWFNARDQSRLRTLLGAAGAASAENGAGLIVLSTPLQEVTPEALVTLYRHFGRPSSSGPLPVRVERWLDRQRSRLGGDRPPELERPLWAEVDGRRVLLRYLSPNAEHPGVLVLSEEASSPRRQGLDALGLTRREAEVVDRVIKGESNAAIGRSLHVSPGTVKKHLDHIYAKLGVSGRVRLTAFVLDVLDR
jgi:DNA-binding CsgD family transcriptional regulator